MAHLEVKISVKFTLQGKIFVITGTLPTLKRDQAKALIQNAGGQVTDTVSAKTNYVVVGEDAGSKLKKAQELGINLLSEAQLLSTISREIGVALEPLEEDGEITGVALHPDFHNSEFELNSNILGNLDKEQFSYAYIHIIATLARFEFVLSGKRMDNEGIDAEIKGRIDGKLCSLALQIKCTSTAIINDDYVRYRLRLKNYNELRDEEFDMPFILVVVLVPDTVDKLLLHSESAMLLNCRAYWTSLRREPAAENGSNITIHLPRRNWFNSETPSEPYATYCFRRNTMKVSIEDHNALKAIQPLQVATYLRATGWQEESQTEGKSSTWVKSSSSKEKPTLDLPLRPDIRRFSHRMAEVLKTVSDIENRSELDIINDIRYSWSDVIRFHINNSDVINGSLLLEDSIHILTSIKEMLLQVAFSITDSKASSPEKDTQSVNYTSRLRIAQTEQGCSYIFTIISPLFPIQKRVENVELSILSNSFERQVVQKFASALETLRIKAEKEASQEKLEFGLIENISAISANFCQSVLRMNERNKNNGLDVRISWSSLLPISDNIPNIINLSANLMPTISIFREKLTTPEKLNYEK